jgi:hypothetical protein
MTRDAPADRATARRVNGAYKPPENLGPRINSAGHEVEPWVAADGSYLIFSAKERSDSTGRYDLYQGRRSRGSWQAPEPLERVNTRWHEFNQSVSPDGQWLYFSSTRPHDGPVGDGSTRHETRRASRGSATGRETSIASRCASSGWTPAETGRRGRDLPTRAGGRALVRPAQELRRQAQALGVQGQVPGRPCMSLPAAVFT